MHRPGRGSRTMPRSVYIDRQEVARLWKAGVSTDQIARQAGVHRNSIIRVANELGLPPQRKEIDVPLLFRLWSEGVSCEVIGRELGISASQVSVLRKRHGLPNRPKRPTHTAPDPTPEEIEIRKAECRAKHMASRRAEDVSSTYSKASKWRRGICQPR